MRHRQWLAVLRGLPLSLLSFVGGLGLFLAGCVDNSGDGAGPKASPPAETDESLDAPIRLSYVCGNRFLITNAYSVAVSVTYRVAGTDEEAEALLSAAPTQDPAFSERLIETRNKGSVELLLNGTPIAVRANGGVPCTPSTPAPALLSVGQEASGEWTAPFDWPVVAVNLTLMSNGKVLSWGHTGQPQVWDPATGTFTEVTEPAELFCAGQSLTTDGRVVVAGGHITDDHGLPSMSIFSPSSQTWTETTPMQRGRWYPTNTTTGNGEVVIIAGRDEAGTIVNIPEIWNPSGAIRQLTTASLSLPYYPRMFLAPNGKLFYAGENQRSRWLKITGTGAWTSGPNRLYGTRDYGAAVMYNEGKILYVGGGRTTNTAETIDLTQSSSAWSWTGSMAFPRRHHNAVILPTGEVLVVGGLSGTAFNDLSTAVHPAEIWNDSTGLWTTLASNTVNRGYHTTAILLPDARVLLTGSGDGAGAPRELNAEIFSPPYLFNGTRPTITSRPTRLAYNTTFRIGTPDASSITRVALIRLGSTTHAFDMNQRFQRLAFTADATGLTVTAPTTRLRTPQGHYLLFILNGSGVPSVGKIVQVK
jgi:galactose oxidase-like protein/glyoxal oxidase-like protein